MNITINPLANNSGGLKCSCETMPVIFHCENGGVFCKNFHVSDGTLPPYYGYGTEPNEVFIGSLDGII